MIYKLLGVIFGASVAATFFIWKSQQVDQSLEQDFVELFERCRTSIETGKPFDSTGLVKAEVIDTLTPEWQRPPEENLWSLPDSEFYVQLDESVEQDGTTRHSCNVQQSDEKHALSLFEQGILLRAFVKIKSAEIRAGTHDFHRDFFPISISSAFSRSEPNSRGCIVANFLFIHEDGFAFSASSVEKKCETEQA